MLRAQNLFAQPLWWDEGYSVFFATRPLAELIERTALDIHPPLYYILLQFWIALFGANAFAIRLFSVFISVVSLPLLYALARALFRDQRAAMLALFLFALAPLHIYYAQEARMYGLVTLFALGSQYFFIRLLTPLPARVKVAAFAALYVFFSAAALYTQYFAAFLLAAQFLYLAIHCPREKISRGLALALGIGALYLPWIIYAGGKLYAYVTAKVAIETYAPLDSFTFLFQHLAAFSVGHLSDWAWLGFTGIFFIFLSLIGGITKTKKSPLPPVSPAPLLVLSLLVPLALGFLVNFRFPFHPVRFERLLLFAAPAFYLLAARGIAIIWARRAAVAHSALALVAAISAASLYDFYSVPRYASDDYRPLIAQVQSLARAGDNFLAIYPWQIGYLETYYRGARLNIIETPNDAWISQPAKMQSDIDALLRARVWLPALQTQGRIVEDALDAALRPRAYSIVDAWHGTTRLEYFATHTDAARGAPLAFQENIRISEWGIAARSFVASEDFVPVWINGQNDALTGINFSLRLVDRNHSVWAQEDRQAAGGIQRIGLAIPAGTPPGEYSIRLALYRARTGQIVRPHSDAPRDDQTLATINITAPTLARVNTISRRVESEFANRVRLLGYDAPAETLRPGFPATISLFWQATSQIEKDFLPLLLIQGSFGKTIAETKSIPARGIYPPTAWRAGEMIRDPQTLIVYGDAADGNYRVALALEDARGTRIKTLDGRDAIALGTVAVKNRAHYFGAPATAHPADARIGDLARLVGYDAQFDPARQSARIVLYWQSLGAPRLSFSGFVHLYDSNDQLIAQRDQIPGAGAFPTTSWVKDEYLVDLYDIELPANAPRGIYKIRVGMYDANIGARAPILNRSNQIVGDYIELSTRIDTR